MVRIKKALNHFEGGMNCTQSILLTFSKELGVADRMFENLAAGFGGGIGHQQKTCGVLTGAVMALGIHYSAQNLPTEALRCKIREIFEKFERKFGSTDCRILLGENMNNAEGRMRIAEKNLYGTKCTQFVSFMVEELGEIIHPLPSEKLL